MEHTFEAKRSKHSWMLKLDWLLTSNYFLQKYPDFSFIDLTWEKQQTELIHRYLSCGSVMGSSEAVISPWSYSHSQLPLPTHLRRLLTLNHKIKPSLCQPITWLHLPVWQCSCTYMEETYQAWPLQLSTETSCWMSHLVAVDQNKWFSMFETQSPEVLWPGNRFPGNL